MTPFHINLHAKPAEEPTLSTVALESKSITSLQYRNPTSERFGQSFEETEARFAEIPRMFLEPDGSFVWVLQHEQSRSQLDGSLIDDGQRLLHVETKGCCHKGMFDQFLSLLGWPEQAILVQLVQQGVFVSESVFRAEFELD